MSDYAPVLIPTLNRCGHLKRCIESLQRNSLASETELYISVDYPPSEKYEEEYKELLKFVESGIAGFREVHIYRQDVNLGVFGNDEFLRKCAFEKHDRYIVSEDDNVFAENFLEYINYYLDKYEEDDDIFAVCGYSYPIDWGMDDYTVIKSNMYSAWGYGGWKKKVAHFGEFQKADIRKYLSSFSRGGHLFRTNRHIFVESVLIACDRHYFPMYDEDGKFCFMDLVLSIRLHMTGERVLMPVLSKVRNEGYDGSGLNCGEEDNSVFDRQKIDRNIHYTPAGTPVELTVAQQRMLNKYFKVDFKTTVKSVLLWAGILISK